MELTWRGLLLGAAITVVFMAANVYIGLRTGVTFSSSVPAAVISMAALRALGGGILENNMVQTQASAAGTLCNVILVLPALVIVGRWHAFPFWQTVGVCLLGGLLGVMYSVPLRRAMVVESDLPFPEGVAAAEVLRAGEGGEGARGRLRDLAAGGLAAAGFTLLGSGLRVLGGGASAVFSLGHAVFRVGLGFSLALVGVGYLVGIGCCLALLLGVAAAWGVGVPLLTAHAGAGGGPGAGAAAAKAWADQIRLVGAGVIAVAGAWTVVRLFRPMLRSIGHAVSRVSRADNPVPREERDLPIISVASAAAALSLPLGWLLATQAASALASGDHAPAIAPVLGLAAAATAFTVVFGFLMATICGYMAGLLGSSSSPVSGIGILGTILISLLLDRLPAGTSRGMMGLALFVTAVIVTISSIANDNLQDLKTGRLVHATPWRQQVALLVGVAAGAAVVAPVLELLYRAYGFAGSLPRPGMDPATAMAAPQASLVAAIARGIFGHTLPWRMLITGIGFGAVLLVVEARLRRRGLTLPTLSVGIGMYLPPTVAVTIAIGGVLGWLADRLLQARRGLRARGAPEDNAERLRRRGVLLSSGFLVGESVAGMGLALGAAFSGHQAPLALVGPGFAHTATLLGAVFFAGTLALFFRAICSAEPDRLTRAAGAD